MSCLSIKRVCFWGGFVLLFVILIGHLRFNSFYFDTDLFVLGDERLIPFSVLSLFAGALMIFGMNTSDTKTTEKRCRVGGIVGVVIWLIIIVSLFIHLVSPGVLGYPGVYSELFGDGIEQLVSYLAYSDTRSMTLIAQYTNWSLLCISGTSLIVFAIRNTMKMDRGLLESSNEEYN